MTDQLSQTSTAHVPSWDVQDLSFGDLPGTTRLYADYVSHYDRVKPFFSHVQPSLDGLAAHHRTIADRSYLRDLLVEVLAEQNRRFGSGDQSLAAVERLGDPQTVAVVTGQQAGLFTGPLYTILKALTTVQLSQELRARGISAVPVFWIECEDHDQDEISSTCVIDQDGQCAPVTYPIAPSEVGKPVKNLILTDTINATIDHLVSLLPSSEFVPDLESQIRAAYEPGTTMPVAFARLLAQWLRGSDLILFDPTDGRLKHQLADLFKRVLASSGDINQMLMAQTQRLVQAGYHAQLRLAQDSVPLFLEVEEKRMALVREGSRFSLKSGDATFTLEQLVEVALTEPERFSPNVALRPMAQDTLLPTLAYVGGPSEIAYFSQITPVFQYLGLPTTPVIPRASATLVEPRYRKLLSSHQLQVQDFFRGVDQVIQSVVERTLARDTITLFDDAQKQLEESLARIDEAVSGADPTLSKASHTARDKMLYQLNSLRGRFIDAQARKQEQTYRQIHRTYNVLIPEGELQERKLNLLHFLSRYGMAFVPQLSDSIDVWGFDHKVISIG